MQENTQKIVADFYQFFNASELDKLFSLIDDDVIQEFNYVKTFGKDNFIKFMTTSKINYDEQVGDYILMVSLDGRCATTYFKVKGKYNHTDDSALPANGQSYELMVINYFEIQNNKIVKGCCWFNEEDWVRQVSKG